MSYLVKLRLACVVFFAAFMAVTTPALAEYEPNSVSRIQISALSVQILISLFVPIAVGLLTKITTTSAVKVILTMVLNAVQALIVQATMADGQAVIDKATFIAWVIALVVSIATYLGIYKPLNVTSSSQGGKLGPHTGPL